ncbi:MAG: hypothetical protein JSW25_07480, partial [Thermoplasmata archaeon]
MLMLTTAVAPTLNKAIEDGVWPAVPEVFENGSSDDWSSSTPPDGAPIIPGHEYDAALAVSRSPSTWILDDNITINVSVDILVVNTYGGPVDGLILEQFLTTNVTLLSASIPPSNNGDYLLWPVGRLDVNESFAVTIDLRVSTASANFTNADDGMVIYGHRGEKAIYSYSPPMRFVNKNLSEYLKATVDANYNDLWVKNTGAGIGSDVESIFGYVQNFVAYESYNGSLRGARGTIWGMAGNSLDQSNLLVALLRNAGIPCRYVTGTLPDDDARTLVKSMFVSGELLYGIAPVSGPVANPSTNATLLGEAKNHTWVEYYKGQDEWVSLDPSFVSAGINDTFTAPVDRFSETPEHWRHHVRIKVRVEEWELFGASLGRLNMRTVFNKEYATAKLAGQNSYMTHEVDKKPHGRESLPFGGVNPYYYETITYQDVLVIANETMYGNTYVETFYPLAAYELLSEEFTAEWLDIIITSPDGTTTTVTRTIFDKVGYEYRNKDGSVWIGEPMMERDPPITGVEIYSILVAPNRVPFTAVEDQLDQFQETYAKYKAEALKNTTKAEKEAFKDAVNRKHIDLLHLAALELAYVSDMRDDTAQGVLQMKSYFIEPRIIIASFEAKDPEFYFILDWRYNDIRGLAYPGVPSNMPFKYQEQKGVTDTDVESELMQAYAPNQTVISLNTIFVQAAEEDVPLIYIRKEWDFIVDRLNISREAAKRIQRALDAGKIVVVPERSVIMADKPRIAWWEQDPVTGKIYSVGEQGLHFSLCGMMCCVAIIGILQSIASTAIGVGGSVEVMGSAMDKYGDAVIAVIDWVAGTSWGSRAEFKEAYNRTRAATAAWTAGAYKTLMYSLELVLSGLSDLGGAALSGMAGTIQNIAKAFGKDIIQTGVHNWARTEFKVLFENAGGSGTVMATNPIVDLT